MESERQQINIINIVNSDIKQQTIWKIIIQGTCHNIQIILQLGQHQQNNSIISSEM